jgi:hypothetical protein
MMTAHGTFRTVFPAVIGVGFVLWIQWYLRGTWTLFWLQHVAQHLLLFSTSCGLITLLFTIKLYDDEAIRKAFLFCVGVFGILMAIGGGLTPNPHQLNDTFPEREMCETGPFGKYQCGAMFQLPLDDYTLDLHSEYPLDMGKVWCHLGLNGVLLCEDKTVLIDTRGMCNWHHFIYKRMELL